MYEVCPVYRSQYGNQYGWNKTKKLDKNNGKREVKNMKERNMDTKNRVPNKA